MISTHALTDTRPASPPLPTPEAARSIPRTDAWTRLDAALLIGVGLLALAVRLPEHAVIPAFTDELAEVSYALEIARGNNQPLTSGGAYKGAFWTWLLAGAFTVGGESLLLPRMLVLTVAVLTVLATYALGRTWAGRVGGLLSAALMATAAGHIAVNSHVAWGSCTTPLFTALGAWALSVAARERGRSAFLLIAGLSWGLAIQTHPLVLALLPGAAIYFLLRGRWLLRTPWPYLGLGLFVLANLNLVVFNLSADFRSINASFAHAEHYTGGDAPTPEVYGRRQGALLLGLLQLLGGAVDARLRPTDVLLDPAVWPVPLLVLAGVVWQWRRGNPLPALLAIGPLLIFPLLNDKYVPILNGRYLAPLLPMLFAAAASLLAAGYNRLRSSSAFGSRWRSPSRLALGGLALGTAFVLLRPLGYLQAYYAQEHAAGRTNTPIFEVLDQLRSARAPDQAVVVVRPARETHLGPGNGLASQTFHLALDLEGVPHQVRSYSAPELADPAQRCRDQLALVASRDADAQRQVVSRLKLRGLDRERVRGGEQPGSYGLYRFDRLPGVEAC